jgi:hypothetical protein
MANISIRQLQLSRIREYLQILISKQQIFATYIRLNANMGFQIPANIRGIL